MKHSIETGWTLSNSELLSKDDLLRIYSLRDQKMPEANIDDYQKYYFDSVFGNDQNSGLSIEKPLKSFTKLAKILESDANVAILLKRGSNFKGNITICRKNNSSTYVGDYGQGPLPVIAGDDSVIQVACSNTHVNNLEITGPNAYRGVHIITSKKGVLENVFITNCYVHDINWRWNLDKDSALVDPDTLDLEKITPEYDNDGVTKGRYFYRYYGGIIAHNEIGPSYFNNIWIVNNIVKNVSRTGITVYNKWVDKPGVGYGYNKWVSYDTPNNFDNGVGYFISTNVFCVGNYVECPGADGIVISSVKNALVKENTCYFANYLGRHGYWNASIWVYNVEDCLFELNEAAYTYKRRGSEDGQGFDLDNCCVNTIFQNNYAHHNEGGGLLICNLATNVIHRNENGEEIIDNNIVSSSKITGKWFNNIVFNNYFSYNGQIDNPTRSAFLTIARESDRVSFVQNTVVISGDIPQQSIIHTEDESTYCYNHLYKDNKFYSLKDNNAQFTIKMMKNYQFIDNTFKNVQPIGSIKNENIVCFDQQLSFKEPDIFKRAQSAKDNLCMFNKFNAKGDYEL